ncbi:MAG: hypothetical protein Q8P02_02540 [Candidatus Micrarchaeota archaeon]|nr:hypothetical protein [Candidatus Micrarchaeota archaeon]
MDILLDTNFLIGAMKRKIDVRAQLEEKFENVAFFVPSRVPEEMDLIPLRERKLAKTLMAALCPIVVQTQGHTDDAIVREAQKRGMAVATQDLSLKKRLKRLNLPIITLSQNRVIVS